MPSKKKCSAGWKKMGYKSIEDCTSYGKKSWAEKAGLIKKVKGSKIKDAPKSKQPKGWKGYFVKRKEIK